MKGRLGFPVRRCAPPGAVENLRQLAGFGSPLISSVLVAWDAPLNSTVTGYRAQAAFAGVGPFVPLDGYDIARAANERYISFSNCYALRIRVAAENGCGLGPWTEISNFTYTVASTATTTHPVTTELALPCPGRSIKVWAIGPGGVAETGGGGGAIVYKTWTDSEWRVNGQNKPFSCVIRNTAGPAGPALASVTLGTETITAYGGSGSIGGNYSGGDGGRNGGPAYSSNTVSFSLPQWTGKSFYGPAYFGGSAGGQGDSGISRATSPCKRMPINPTYFSDLSTVVGYAGAKSVEDCGTTAAVGSGGVRIATADMWISGNSTFDEYGNPIPNQEYLEADTYFSAGYGGGGFDENYPGGPGLVVVKYF